MEFYPVTIRRELDITPINPLLLVSGDGSSLLNDLKWFIWQSVDADIMAIGRSINIHADPVRHWASVDSEELKNWAENLPGDPIRHTMGDWPWFDVDWGIKNCDIKPDDIIWHGSSSLFCAYIGLAMGYEKILLAGCPLDNNGHWYFEGLPKGLNTGPAWNNQSYDAWREFAQLPESKKVRSLSGFTAEILGKPTEDWIIA